MDNNPPPRGPKDVVLGVVCIVFVALLFVLSVRSFDESDRMQMNEPPEQTYLHTGAERRFFAELKPRIDYAGPREADYLTVAHAWCGSMADGGRAHEVIPHLGEIAVSMDLDPRLVRPIVGSATLRICPEHSAAADSYYGER